MLVHAFLRLMTEKSMFERFFKLKVMKFRKYFLRKSVFIRNSVLMSYFCCICLVQHECIPQAVLGMDILCQAKSGKKSLKLTKMFPFAFPRKVH